MAYAPVNSTLTSGSTVLAHLQSYRLRRKALDALRPVFRFYQVCDHDVLELRSGKTMRFYRYTNMAASSTPSPEGVVGTSLNIPPSKTLDATVAMYSDFMTVSDMLRDVAPDAIMERMADEMGFRAGLSVDNITRGVIDSETSAVQSAQATYLSVRDFRAAFSILQGRNVQPTDSGWFEALTHPYTAFDLVNDPSANGLADIYKYTDPSKSGSIKLEDRGLVANVASCRIKQSTNVKQTSGSPNTWRTYVFGKGAVGTVSLSGWTPGQIEDPNKQEFQVFSKTENTPSVANPTGSIGGFVSYKFAFVTKVLEGPSPIGGLYRYAMLDTPSSIVG